jgi:hemin uptake protein HemP
MMMQTRFEKTTKRRRAKRDSCFGQMADWTAELFVGTREITVLRRGETYYLRLTAQNKLVLIK